MRRHYLRLIVARVLVAWFVHCTLCFVKTKSYNSGQGLRRLRSPRSIFRCSGTERSSCGIFAKRSYKRSPCRTHKHARTHARTHNVISWWRRWWLLALPGQPRTTRYCTRRFSTDTYRASQNQRKKSGRYYFLRDLELVGENIQIFN